MPQALLVQSKQVAFSNLEFLQVFTQILARETLHRLGAEPARAHPIQQGVNATGMLQPLGMRFDAVKIRPHADVLGAAQLRHVVDVVNYGIQIGALVGVQEGGVKIDADIAAHSKDGFELIVRQVTGMVA